MPVLEIVQRKYSSSELPYHFIVPSLPGYLFSSGPGQAQAYTSQDAARVINKAMTALGFSRYVVQGGDVGSLIASILATNYDSVAAIHLNLLPSLEMSSVDDPSLSSKEKEAIEYVGRRFLTPTTGAALLQSTRPATIVVMVSSSPLALLAWRGEKFLEWPDDPIGIDELLTNVTLYWLTETMPRCIYTYRGTFIDGHQYSFPAFRQSFGYSWFMKELVPVPEKLAKKHGNLVFYRQQEKGGHFAALERPVEFLRDIEDFVKSAGF
ncbi:alpha/beta-hydrolase [Colletotrichum scovillei]|uniref:Alpha/beta-hydrolase n=1 Tax=Colletotrichum scovillei TaxID=1209932 RepID=A0A9P7UGL1_9PEZI|nr:alpha/beta-hydrolase [Colletotrichum scovillei]KAG7075610.1 alpha/beta-hydrolase [Colletotrichum scovillei]KAG7082723.1 alpha/beta-hydrolase [Colletotrichum scovillei]